MESLSVSSSKPVTFQTRPAKGGKLVAVATLNAEKSLNSLTLEMVDLLQDQLTAWESDEAVVCVFLQGAGDKAFCAGGDVVEMHRTSAAYGEILTDTSTQDFFTREYRLDHHIHTYDKPIVVWGHGIVMGGGMGLMSGASHRVVTERSRMAMPEVTIGLFPDVGGTFFLNHAPGKTGLFLGLTGASFNAADAKFVGMADRFIEHTNKADVLDALCETDWKNAAETEGSVVSSVLRRFEQQSLAAQPKGQVQEHLDWINDVCDANSTAELVTGIVSYSGEDEWLQRAIKGLVNGCPVTPYLVAEQMRRGKHMSLADIFRMELTMAVNCTRRGHFKEGVRALLIDKDREPKWVPATVAEVPSEEIEAFFIAPWADNAHPLRDL
jgi:enoyl-CoA hydratase/carnithine racemase